MKTSKDYNQLVSSKGWKRLSEIILKSAKDISDSILVTGKINDEQKELIIRANERVRIVNEVEKVAKKTEQLEDDAREIKKIN